MLIYCLVAGLWIIFSDRLVAHAFHDPALTSVNTAKGLGFVAASAAFFFAFLRHQLRKWENEEIQRKQVEVASRRLAAIVESSRDVIVGIDLDNIVTSWNSGAEKISGVPASQAIGKSILACLPEGQRAEELRILEQVKRGEKVEPFETVRRLHDGRVIDLSMSVFPIRDLEGRITGVARMSRDITLLKQHEREVIRLSRLYSALSEVNHVIVTSRGRSELLDKICRALTERGGFRTAWIGRLDPEARKVIPVVQSGDDTGYISHIAIDLDDPVTGDGPTGRTVRQAKRYICNDFAADPCTLPWREPAARAKYGASATFPIFERGALFGAINVYSDEIGYFQDKEVALLDEATRELSFALDNLAKEAARRRAEAQLAGSEQQYRELVELANSIIVRWTSDGKVTFLNEFGQRFFGFSASEIVGRHVLETIVPPTESSGRDLQHLMEQICADPAAFEHNINENICRDGRRVFIDWTNRIIKDEHGHVREILSIGTDITDRKAAEQKIRQLNTELEQRVTERTVQLETANKELEAFSYSVSHDLRAPLRAVNGLAKMVLDDFSSQLDPEGRRYLERIRLGGQRMGQLIDDLLAFSRLSRQPLDRRHIHVAKLVQTVLDDLSPRREGQSLDIRVGPLPDCEGDPNLLRQVWVNLISNAIKYTGQRDTALIEIGAQSTPHETVYFVRDNGAGFDMQFADKLFKVFQRLHRSDEFEGIGVGLAIVQRIVQRHGGRVWAESREGHGATFFFTLAAEKLT